MKVFVDAVGCRLNQSEIEKIADQFRALGHQVVASDADADVVVINTCTVTGKALSDSRRLIRRAGRNPHTKIIATGCWATIDPDDVAQLPGVIDIVDNSGKEQLVEEFLAKSIPVEMIHERNAIPGGRFRTRAFVKAQDGCDNYCTFCVTRIARGRARSMPLGEVIEEVNRAQRGGVKEVVLTGVNLASWGFEMTPQKKLSDLVNAILSETGIDRLRLSSVEPWELDQDFFKVLKNQRMCRQLHLPLQSGSDAVLKRMGRKTTQSAFSKLVVLAREIQPEIALTTDIIVGFPGETEEQFSESLAFIEHVQFSGGHVFTYSPRPGTPAFKFVQDNPVDILKKRSLQTRTLFNKMNLSYREKHVGQIVYVLWEKSEPIGIDRWKLSGLSDNYIRVETIHHANRWNEIDPVKLMSTTTNGMAGDILAGKDAS